MQTDFSKCKPNPNQYRWLPLKDIPFEGDVDFVQGMITVAGAGDPSIKNGIAIHLYAANKSMGNKAFYNADGDYLIGKFCLCLPC